MLVVDIMGGGREFQLRLFEQALLFTVIPLMDGPVVPVADSGL